jgi:hypothetical protein
MFSEVQAVVGAKDYVRVIGNAVPRKLGTHRANQAIDCLDRLGPQPEYRIELGYIGVRKRLSVALKPLRRSRIGLVERSGPGRLQPRKCASIAGSRSVWSVRGESRDLQHERFALLRCTVDECRCLR